MLRIFLAKNRVQFPSVSRGLDDSNLVIVATTFDSREAAERLMNNPALAETMGRAAVIQSSMRIDYVEEVAGGRG